MKSIICLPLDFQKNSLGLQSLLEQEIDGASVLYHTVSRLTLCDDYTVVLLIEAGPEADRIAAKARELLGALHYEAVISGARDVPNREFLRRARLWSIRSWRGGLGSASWYDEAGSPAAMNEAAGRFGAEAVGLMMPDSPYADPHLTSKLFAWHYEHARNARVTLTGVCPGLVPVVFASDLLKSLADQNLTLAAALAYRANQPQRDLTATEAHFEAPLELRLAPWRLTAHSPRQLDLIRALVALGTSPRSASATDVVHALAAHPELWPGRFPAKLEIEPTMRIDAAPSYLKRITNMRGASDLDLGAFRRMIEPLGAARDVVVSLQGLGEPLLNPALDMMVSSAKKAGIMGVHVGTYGRLLDESFLAALSAAHLDVLSVHLGAGTPSTYRALFGVDGLESVKSQLEGAFARRAASQSVTWPIFVAEIAKMRSVEAEIEPFFDYWLSHCDWPAIRPYNDFAGQVDDLATIHMRTSSRIPCRKVFEELYIDAEGIAYPCRQDIRRTHPLGSAVEEGIEGVWRCAFMERLRAAQLAGDYDLFPLCRNCKDWYYV